MQCPEASVIVGDPLCRHKKFSTVFMCCETCIFLLFLPSVIGRIQQHCHLADRLEAILQMQLTYAQQI